MPLSEYERRVLNEIESDLAAEDGAHRLLHRWRVLVGLVAGLLVAGTVGVVVGAAALPVGLGIAFALVVGVALGAAGCTLWRRCWRRG
jgi:hypothetical protein